MQSMTLSEKWEIENHEKDIMEYLDNDKKVYIEDGCLNDEIVSYSIVDKYKEKEIAFITSACVFPKEINFMDQGFEIIKTEDFKGDLFVYVR